MDNIAKKECQNDVINLLQEKEYNEDGVRMFFRNFVNIEVEEQLKDEVNKYKEKQKRRIIDVYNAFNEDTPNEIKKIKMVERLPFRTALRDYERYFKIQCILSKLLYNGTHDFNVYKVIPYYEAISLDDIEKIKEYLENNGIYLKNENFIKDKLCNYGELYKDEDGIKKDFDRLSHHHEYILKENSDLIIRRYSELCIYNMLKNNLKSYEEIKWVSKDICDALGYNVIIIDKLLSSVKMINVKSTYFKNDPLEDCLVLTKEEYQKLEESNKNNVPYIMYKINYDLDNFVAEFYKIEHKSNGIYAVTNLNDNTTYESTFVKDNETDGNMKIKIKETIKVKEEPHKLKLKLSKCNILSTSQGVDFLGYRHFSAGYILVRKSTAKRMKKNIKALKYKLAIKKVSKESALSTVASVEGWLKWANAYNLKKSLQLEDLKKSIGGSVGE